MKKKLLRVLDGETVYPPPLWLMRQAGRYLPEYRRTRGKAGSFLDLCYNPELAVEVTLQPIRRFGFDAAILFSDILVVPHALGCDVSFEEGRGPVMTPVEAEAIDRLDGSLFHVNLEPVLESVRRLAVQVGEETALIGFCGAPWTVATYMIAGHSTPDQAPARLFAYRHPEAFERLLDLLADLSADYLGWQLDAGAEAVQIFDSWAGVLDQSCFESFCVRPVERMVSRLRATHPGARIIGFPKGAGGFYDGYREVTGVDVLGLDWMVPLAAAAGLQRRGAVQGNLDPLRVVAGGRALDEGVESILGMLAGGPFIFNLGHGITPDAPLDNVERLVRRVRGYGEG